MRAIRLAALANLRPAASVPLKRRYQLFLSHTDFFSISHASPWIENSFLASLERSLISWAPEVDTHSNRIPCSQINTLHIIRQPSATRIAPSPELLG